MRCPDGHDSTATDYCDVCGIPMDAAASSGPEGSGAVSPGTASGTPAPPAPAPAMQECPHCEAPNHADALFCEACGYDFTTGAAPMDGTAPQVVEEPGAEPEPVEEEPVEEPAPEVAEESPEPGEPEPEPQPEPEVGTPEPSPEPAPVAHPRPRHAPPSRSLSDVWVVESWIDPDWYAVQDTAEQLPSPGLPGLVLVRRNVVTIGRPSGSLGRPDVDVGIDSAVSRRHAQLTSDGHRWWLEDLGSSNGTFVGQVDQPLPQTPLTPGRRVEVDQDDRIYVGAWTRLVIRRATDSEREGQG